MVVKKLTYAVNTAILGAGLVLGGCGDCRDINTEIVNVPVVSDSKLWSISRQEDTDGDRLISPDMSWPRFSYEAYEANGVKDARALQKIAQEKGYIKLPRNAVNPDYNF